MHLLYDSESFAVTHLAPEAIADPSWRDADATQPTPSLIRHGFEIVDKRSGKEVYLDGSWAELFQEQLHAWQRQSPTQEEVEDTLDGYTGLAQMPLLVH